MDWTSGWEGTWDEGEHPQALRMKEAYMQAAPPMEGCELQGLLTLGVWLPTNSVELVAHGDNVEIRLCIILWPAFRRHELMRLVAQVAEDDMT